MTYTTFTKSYISPTPKSHVIAFIQNPDVIEKILKFRHMKMGHKEIKGSPIKGLVKRKNTSLFHPQLGLVSLPVSRPLFRFYRFTVSIC